MVMCKYMKKFFIAAKVFLAVLMTFCILLPIRAALAKSLSLELALPKTGDEVIMGSHYNINFLVKGSAEDIESLVGQDRLVRIYLLKTKNNKTGYQIVSKIVDTDLVNTPTCSDANTCEINQSYDWVTPTNLNASSQYFIRVYLREKPSNTFGGFVKTFLLQNKYPYIDSGKFTFVPSTDTTVTTLDANKPIQSFRDRVSTFTSYLQGLFSGKTPTPITEKTTVIPDANVGNLVATDMGNPAETANLPPANVGDLVVTNITLNRQPTNPTDTVGINYSIKNTTNQALTFNIDVGYKLKDGEFHTSYSIPKVTLSAKQELTWNQKSEYPNSFADAGAICRGGGVAKVKISVNNREIGTLEKVILGQSICTPSFMAVRTQFAIPYQKNVPTLIDMGAGLATTVRVTPYPNISTYRCKMNNGDYGDLQSTSAGIWLENLPNGHYKISVLGTAIDGTEQTEPTVLEWDVKNSNSNVDYASINTCQAEVIKANNWAVIQRVDLDPVAILSSNSAYITDGNGFQVIAYIDSNTPVSACSYSINGGKNWMVASNKTTTNHYGNGFAYHYYCESPMVTADDGQKIEAVIKIISGKGTQVSNITSATAKTTGPIDKTDMANVWYTTSDSVLAPKVSVIAYNWRPPINFDSGIIKNILTCIVKGADKTCTPTAVIKDMGNDIRMQCHKVSTSNSESYGKDMGETCFFNIKYQAEDLLGYKSDVLKQTIKIDNTLPTDPEFIEANGAFNSIDLKWKASSDSDSGIDKYAIRYTKTNPTAGTNQNPIDAQSVPSCINLSQSVNAGNTIWLTQNQVTVNSDRTISYKYPITDAARYYRFRICAVDKMGNVSWGKLTNSVSENVSPKAIAFAPSSFSSNDYANGNYSVIDDQCNKLAKSAGISGTYQSVKSGNNYDSRINIQTVSLNGYVYPSGAISNFNWVPNIAKTQWMSNGYCLEDEMGRTLTQQYAKASPTCVQISDSNWSPSGDTTPPSVSDDYVFGSRVSTSPVYVNITAIDPSGIANIKYCSDTTNVCYPNTSVNSNTVRVGFNCVAGSMCLQYVRYAAWDKAGNASSIKSTAVTIDLRTNKESFKIESIKLTSVTNYSASLNVKINAPAIVKIAWGYTAAYGNLTGTSSFVYGNNYFSLDNLNLTDPKKIHFSIWAKETETADWIKSSDYIFDLHTQIGELTPVTPNVSNCTDSDNGKNYNIKGTVTLGSQTFTDVCDVVRKAASCQSAGSCINAPDIYSVKEYYCENNVVKNEIHECGNAGETCVDGACKAAQAVAAPVINSATIDDRPLSGNNDYLAPGSHTLRVNATGSGLTYGYYVVYKSTETGSVDGFKSIGGYDTTIVSGHSTTVPKPISTCTTSNSCTINLPASDTVYILIGVNNLAGKDYTNDVTDLTGTTFTSWSSYTTKQAVAAPVINSITVDNKPFNATETVVNLAPGDHTIAVNASGNPLSYEYYVIYQSTDIGNYDGYISLGGFKEIIDRGLTTTQMDNIKRCINSATCIINLPKESDKVYIVVRVTNGTETVSSQWGSYACKITNAGALGVTLFYHLGQIIKSWFNK